MAGLIVLGLAGAYVALFWLITAKANGWGKRIGVLAVAIAIPFWEFPFGYWTLLQHCKLESGIHVGNEFTPSDSILFFNYAYKPAEAAALGYKTIEYLSQGNVIRYTRVGEELEKSTHRQPTSKISYRAEGWQELPWGVARYDYLVTRLADGKVVARQTDFNWSGLYWERALRVWITPQPRCEGAMNASLLRSLPKAKQ